MSREEYRAGRKRWHRCIVPVAAMCASCLFSCSCSFPYDCSPFPSLVCVCVCVSVCLCVCVCVCVRMCVCGCSCCQELLDNQSKVGGAPNISFSRSVPMELQGEGAPPVSITPFFAGFISFGENAVTVGPWLGHPEFCT